MKLIIVARQLGIQSEHWLKRQIELLKDQIELVVVLGKSSVTHVSGVPVKSLAFEHELKYKVLTKIFSKDILEYKKTKLQHIIEHSNADLVMFHYIDFALNFKDIIQNTNKQCYVYCHGYDVTWDLRKHNNPNEKVFLSEYTDKVLELSHGVQFIANSKSTQNKLTSIGVKHEKIKTKYFGVEKNEFRPIPSEFTLLFLGRLVDFKGPHLVLQAFEKACELGMKGNMIFAGDGPLRETIELLRQNSKYKDRIEILGGVNYDTAQELFHKASVFVAHNCNGQLTLQEEAFGVSIIEAMSFGIPVITGASGGTKETIVHNETGFLFDPFDVDAQKDYFLKYYSDNKLLLTHSENAQKYVRNNFSLEQEYKWYQQILS
ncbi:glycosyltransferase family 4 protein [uncultured Formosa sp.]|uniref:glycosyltransferase family 4 protein n=1 Tax=uncultured Formosa sp. TaxID=255435 RepID=UPI00262D5E80|nr:glycosyltransferase family 4 protein [uncultured Formosa sp.]